MKTGLYDLENSAYRAILDHVSISELNRFGISPLNYDWEYNRGNRMPSSKSQEVGTDIHAYVLEPGYFLKTYQVKQKYDKRTIEGKKLFEADEKREKTGLRLLDQASYDLVRFAGDALLDHPFVKENSNLWKAEASMFWVDRDTNVLCKGRVDSYTASAIIDVKTTQSVSGFPSSIVDYGYHRQAAYYLDGMMEASGGESQISEFYWAVVEPKAPYLCKVFKASPQMIERGRYEYKNLLSRFSECKAKNYWPGLSTDVEELQLPDWYLRKPIEMFKRGEEF